jgi:hypothetical protein
MSEVYWIDSSVFFQAANGLYSFDFAQQFWDWLDEQIKLGTIRAPITVYDELVPTTRDTLGQWAFERSDSGFFVLPEEAVVSELRVIVDYVHSLDRAHADAFMKGADPWLIAHAKAVNGIVVTEEKPVDASSRRIKIPNVCQRFGVTWIDTKEFLRRLKFKFSS